MSIAGHSVAEPKEMSMWVLTRSPKDYPDKYVARRWELRDGEYKPTLVCEVRDTVDEIKALDVLKARFFIPRHRTDDPVIVGTWI